MPFPYTDFVLSNALASGNVSGSDGTFTNAVRDIHVTMPGQSYTINRYYSSKPQIFPVTGATDLDQAGFLSAGWSMDCFKRLYIGGSVPPGNGVASGTAVISGGPLHFNMTLDQDSTETDLYHIGGPGQITLRLESDTYSYPSSSTFEYDVNRLREPGGGYIDFVDDITDTGMPVDPDLAEKTENMQGLVLREVDQYGNAAFYTYEFVDTDFPMPDQVAPRIKTIELFTRDNDPLTNMSATPVATLNFAYNNPTGMQYGYLTSISVTRPDGGGQIETQRVEYRYMGLLGFPDTGTFDDAADAQFRHMTEVAHLTRVDGQEPGASASNHAPSGADTFYKRITQYRYHIDPPLGPPPTDERLAADGSVTQLKAIIGSEQLEYFAEALGQNGSKIEEIETAAKLLRVKEFDESLASSGLAGYIVADIASVVLGYDTTSGEVTEQFLQADCGCSTGQATKLSYEYINFRWQESGADGDHGRTTKVTQYTNSATGVWGTEYRRFYADYRRFSDTNDVGAPAFLVNSVTAEAAGGSPKFWVTHYEYNESSANAGYRNLSRKFTPSSITGYTPIDDASIPDEPGITFKSTGMGVANAGLVYEYTYTDDDRIEETRIRSADGLSYEAVQKVTHLPDTDASGRRDLYQKVERFRVAGSVAADNVETVEYDFGFHPSIGDDKASVLTDKAFLPVAWMKMTTEHELVSENGPGGSTVRFEIYNDLGQNIWTVLEDNSLIKREYDANTGHLTKVVQNAAPPMSWTDIFVDRPTPDPSGDWGKDGGSTTYASLYGEATTEYERDHLGRIIRVTDPAGVATYTLRGLYVNHDPRDGSIAVGSADAGLRPGLRYYVEIDLPMKLTGASSDFDGPAVYTWYNAGGEVIRRSEFTIDVGTTYQPDWTVASLSYKLEADTTELGVGEISRTARVHNISGDVEKDLAWIDVSGGLTNWPDEDGTASDHVHTTTYTYDELGRVEKIVDAKSNVTEFTFDVLDRTTSVSRGVGVSTVKVTDHVFDGSGGSTTAGVGNGNLTAVRRHTGEGSEIRTIYQYFDQRDRLVTRRAPVDEAGNTTGNEPDLAIAYDNLDRPIEQALQEFGHGLAYPITPTQSVSSRVWYEKVAYSQRGEVYRTEYATDPTQASPAFLELNAFYDERRRLIAHRDINDGAKKTTYDTLSRIVRDAMTDFGGDADPGSSGAHADAAGLVGDRVVEQTNYTYDFDAVNDTTTDQLLGVETLYRLDDYTGEVSTDPTGALTAGTSGTGIATRIGYYYDSADRIEHIVDFGTDGSTDVFGRFVAPSSFPPATVPNRSTDTDVLITSYTYNDRGLVEDAIYPELDDAMTPRARQVRTFYNDLAMPVITIGNAQTITKAVDGAPSAASEIGWDSTGVRWTVEDGMYTSMGFKFDEDRATSRVFDPFGNTIKLVAHTGDPATHGTTPAFQETKYVYDATAGSASNVGDSLINSRTLLTKVQYPNEATGEAGTTAEFTIEYAYNRLGEIRAQTDQNGTIRVLERDSLGRITGDDVNTFGAGVDQTIDRLEYVYDGAGRLTRARSKDGTTTTNEVVALYTKLWQTQRFIQDVDSGINGSYASESGRAAREVSYGYDNVTRADWSSHQFPASHSRISTITYPTENEQMGTPDTVTYRYDTGVTNGSLNDRISRIAAIAVYDLDPAAPGTAPELARYDYVGAAMISRKTFPEVIGGAVRLDRAIAADGAFAIGEYKNWDRFGRTTTQLWVDDGFDVHASLADQPNIPPIVAERYTYDRDSNRLTNTDARPGPRPLNTDFYYGYDDLDRLTLSERTTTPDKGSERWTHDFLGNWDQFEAIKAVSGSYLSETRDHNEANELDEVSPNGPTTPNGFTSLFTHDKNGNRTQHRRQKGMQQSDTDYTYDAWNRLVQIDVTGPATTGKYEYNALHMRTVREADTAKAGANGIDERRHYWYTAGWKIAEEEVDIGYSGGTFTPDRVTQHFWGLDYIDDALASRIDRDTDGAWETDSVDSLYYKLCSIQHSVVAILEGDGTLVERVVYQPYGEGRHHYPFDLDGDGDVDTGDTGLFVSGQAIGDANYIAEADLDRDGDLDFFDISGLPTYSALPDGWISDPTDSSGPDNISGYTGREFDVEDGLYCYRYRVYDPDRGRFLQRDPITQPHFNGLIRDTVNALQPPVLHADTANQTLASYDLRSLENWYEYTNSSPIIFTDSLGLTPQNPDTPLREAWYRYNNCKADCVHVYGTDGLRDSSKRNTCLDKCNRQMKQDLQSATGSYPRLRDSSPECDEYDCDDTYFKSNARCFCKCAGNSRWSQDVRGCLRKLYKMGVSPHVAHVSCYKSASLKGFNRPEMTLLGCWLKCQTAI